MIYLANNKKTGGPDHDNPDDEEYVISGHAGYSATGQSVSNEGCDRKFRSNKNQNA